MEVIEEIKEAGMYVGIALKPATPAEALLPYLEDIDMVGAWATLDALGDYALCWWLLISCLCGDVVQALVMSVEPGFGGQSFMPATMQKVKVLRQASAKLNIQVDGGLAPKTIAQAADAGANIIVAGSAVFGAQSPADVMSELRQVVDQAAAITAA